tara:strand:- start:549 stop:710 length:162 start_codon:yes stop_codon:yes gene_type:complete
MKYHRYFKAQVDERGQPIQPEEDNIEEVYPPVQNIILSFSIGILMGCILMKIF